MFGTVANIAQKAGSIIARAGKELGKEALSRAGRGINSVASSADGGISKLLGSQGTSTRKDQPTEATTQEIYKATSLFLTLIKKVVGLIVPLPKGAVPSGQTILVLVIVLSILLINFLSRGPVLRASPFPVGVQQQ